ncbi:MAG: hypothetical protein V6Z89_14415 [Desulfobacter sp.]
MKKLLKKIKTAKTGIITALGVAATTPAYAAIDLTGVSVDTADYIAIATFLITALVAFWGIRKGLALLGR